MMLKSELEKVLLDDNEDGKEKAEKKTDKQSGEDNFPVYHLFRPGITPNIASCKIPLRHHNPYQSFFDQPNTPPPDLV
ncbi:hypothetical protein [Segetibacter aerophilus]|nr:hypothetical protein [Segetibacter aerophilus]